MGRGFNVGDDPLLQAPLPARLARRRKIESRRARSITDLAQVLRVA
jgi:hypothetical protein